MTNTETLTSRPVRVHVAEVEPYNVNIGRADEWVTPEFTNDVTKIRLKARHQSNRVCTWSVLFVGPEGVAMNLNGPGKHVAGPWAALICNSTVISSHRYPGDAPKFDHLVEGDYVSVRGFLFRIDDSRGRAGYDPRLILVTD